MMKEFIQNMPKAELQVHIEGCLTPQMMFEFAKRNKIELPFANIEEATKAIPFKIYPRF